MTEGDARVGQITRTSALRNRYTIELGDQSVWTFRMPLFKIHYYGVATTGAQVFVVVGGSHMEWYVLTDQRSDDPRLLCALAFIHNHRWSYG